MNEIRYRWWLFRVWVRSIPEKLAWFVAWRLPRSVAYLCAIRLWAHASQGEWGNESPCGMPMDKVLDRWGRVF